MDTDSQQKKAETQTLERRILSAIREERIDFEELALDIFRYQFAHNLPYRAFARSLGATPEMVRAWEDIPAVPTQAFRAAIPLSCWEATSCERVFLTSGTTSEKKGRHYLRDLNLYRASVWEGWRNAGLPGALPLCFLSRPPEACPESSLVCMFEILHREVREPPFPWMLDDEQTIALEVLNEIRGSGRPLVLCGTALAFHHYFDRVRDPQPLPNGSWVFQTGGYKGLEGAHDPQALYERIVDHFGVPPMRIINEYGMTELSTPSYALGPDNSHRTPPWLRVRAIDPERNQPVAGDREGHLAFLDLANLNSVCALRTQDLGRVLDDHTFVLRGRDPAALPRGCSRASDAYFRSS